MLDLCQLPNLNFLRHMKTSYASSITSLKFTLHFVFAVLGSAIKISMGGLPMVPNINYPCLQ